MAKKNPHNLAVEIERWTVVTTWSANVPKAVLAVLKRDERVSKVHGCWHDLLIRHGDDGGWCVDVGEQTETYRWLEAVREAARFDRQGTVFHLLIKTE